MGCLFDKFSVFFPRCVPLPNNFVCLTQGEDFFDYGIQVRHMDYCCTKFLYIS